ncbi:MAG: TolC family protein [Candidatus Omnitrophota bacterium]|nr:TolC family protein [Candidatus Omnitrophota bacterium]
MKLKNFIIPFVVIFITNAGGVCAGEALEWKECVREAIKQHPELMTSLEKVNQAKANKEITRSAVMPQITGNASETTAKGAAFGSSGGTGQSDITVSSTRKPKTTYEYSVTGQQLLFDGFKTSFDLSSAERNIVSSRYNYDVTSSNIRLRLKTAFSNLLSSQELLKVTEEIEARRKQNLELVKLRYEGGREHRGSLLTAEADVAQASYDVNQAGRSIYFSQRQLTKELGRSSFRPMAAKGELEVKERVSERPNFDELVETTPFLQQLIAQKEAAKFGLKSAYADFFPQVYASGNIGNSNVDAFPDKNEWSGGVSLTLPIFDGGNRFAAVSKAKAVLGQASDDERSGRDSVILTLADTWTRLQNTVENVAVQRKFLEATEERAKIARAEYAIGLMSFDNWIIIENNLASAKKSFVNSEVNSLIAEAGWVQAKGGTLDYDKE